jgi:hypothetical protein
MVEGEEGEKGRRRLGSRRPPVRWTPWPKWPTIMMGMGFLIFYQVQDNYRFGGD